jgi:hypothetical protein
MTVLNLTCVIIFQVLEPPAEYLEEDITSKDDQRVPPDALYMLQSIRYCSDYFVITFTMESWCYTCQKGEHLCYFNH